MNYYKAFAALDMHNKVNTQKVNTNPHDINSSATPNYTTQTQPTKNNMPAYVLTCISVILCALAAAACGNSEIEDAAKLVSATNLVPEEQEERLEDRVVVHIAEQKNHVLTDVDYTTSPPTGGDHFPAWQNCIFYTLPVKDTVAVHSLEHGAVWIAYRDDLDAKTLASIKSRVEAETHLLASPYPNLQSPLVLTAWERYMPANSWSDPLVNQFIRTYMGRRSPTAPEAGASCSQAIGKENEPNFLYEEVLKQELGNTLTQQ